MSLASDLLEQAEFLARREKRRPRQASLRRAVSTAYYALFHLLVADAASRLVKDQHLQRLVARAFEHGEMRKAAIAFASSNLPPYLAAIAGGAVPQDLIDVASAFVDLQEARHEADYNLASTFRRTRVQGHVDRVRKAFESWDRVKGQDIAKVFLAALLLAHRWKR